MVKSQAERSTRFMEEMNMQNDKCNENLKEWQEIAQELTKSDLKSAMERTNYSVQISKITSYSGIGGFCRGTASDIIDKLTDTISNLIRCLAGNDYENCSLPPTPSAVLSEILQLTTVFFHFIYTVPEDRRTLHDEDDLEEFDDYHETDEYKPRNKLLEHLMALLILGAQKAKSFGERSPAPFIEAIKTLQRTSHEQTGTGLSRKEAVCVANGLTDGLDELRILAKISRPRPDSTSTVDILKDFFTPENSHYGLNQIWYSEKGPFSADEEDESDEDWAKRHSGETIGRFLIEYKDGYLSIRDIKRWKKQGKNKTRYDYPNIAQCGKMRFEALIALLRQLKTDGGTPKNSIRPPEDHNWRGQFQKTNETAYRFKQDQIFRHYGPKKKPTSEWRLKSDHEIKP